MPEGGPTNVGKYERIMVALMRGKLEVVLGLTWAKKQEGKAIESGENVFRGLKYIQKELRVLDEIQSLKTLEDVRTFCQRKELNFEEILEEVKKKYEEAQGLLEKLETKWGAKDKKPDEEPD